jgi:hypothetical protein
MRSTDGITVRLATGSAPQARWWVQLAGSDELLTNPGIGLNTSSRFNGDRSWHPLALRHRMMVETPPVIPENEFWRPATSVTYWRWYWSTIEPERGRYRWDIIDEVIELARQHGQQLHFRVMSHDHLRNIPPWYLQAGRVHKTTREGKECWYPDYDDPLFRSAAERLIGELGRRYDGHADVVAVDIGTLGFWGEWHLQYTPHEQRLWTQECNYPWAIDAYTQAFGKTRLLGLIGSVGSLARALAAGAGWRADCWGDLGDQWRHMHTVYPRHLHLAGAGDAWKHALVCLETCWTMPRWHRQGWDIDYILAEGLRYHVSLINDKSAQTPEPWRGKIEAFLKKVGYRLSLRTAEFPQRLSPGSPWTLMHWWVNRGVAPCYGDYRLAVRLQSPQHTRVLELPHRLVAWLPDDDQYNEDRLVLPADVPRQYTLAMGIVRAGGEVPAVKMANAGRDENGWLTLGPMEVLAANG